ncbi:zinc finger protein 142 [Lissotriton helveticus]
MTNLCAELLLLPSVSSTGSCHVGAEPESAKQDADKVIEGTHRTISPLCMDHDYQVVGIETAHQGTSLEETCTEAYEGVLVEEGSHYLCQKCGANFPYSSLLSPHQCTMFSQSENLDFHVASHLSLTGHIPEMPSYGQESKAHHTRRSLRLCKAQSSTEDSGQEHNIMPLDTENVFCPICKEQFTQLDELKGHFKCHSHHQEVFTCTNGDCRFATDERKLFHIHLQRVHKVTPIPCAHNACQLLFTNADDMSQHHRTHFPFHCLHCSFVSSNVKVFWQHRKNHVDQAEDSQSTPTRNIGLKALSRCNKCDFTTVSKKTLTHHLLLHSDGDVSQEEQNSRETGDQGDHVVSSASDGSLQDRRGSAREENSESKEDSSSSSEEEETGEYRRSLCNVAQGKRAPHMRAQGARVRHFKGDVEEGTEYLFKTHMCPECKRCFKKRTHLVEHLHLHFPDPSLQCPNCQRFFTSRSKLKIHMMRELGEKSHRCPLCDYSSVEKNALNRHMASMHEDISNFYSDTYACPVCEDKFRLSQTLKEHMKTHKAEQQLLICFQQDCGSSTTDRKEFVRHLKEAHSIRAVECRYHACSLLFTTREEMELHRQSHYAFHCDQCTFVCSNKHAFRKHKRQGHPGSEELECDFCPFKTFNPVEFSDHVGKMHANEKIHKCTECEFATAHKRVLIRHMLLHTGEKPHKCQRCEFTCRDVSYLSKHMLTHSSDKNYMCTECGYVTKWKHYLNVHMRKHTGDLRYRCNQCSYRCHRADQLSSHKLRHQGKSLICEVCGFACKRKYELQKHKQAKHSQNYQMPVYHCQYCSYQSKYKQALHNHENCKHTKQKEFRCALCTYRTFSNTSLFLHKRKTHGYVPGDKDWLENYANKEQEINSADVLINYDLSAALRLEANLTTSGRDAFQRGKSAPIEDHNNDFPQIHDVAVSGSEHSQFKPQDSLDGGPTDYFSKMSSVEPLSHHPDRTFDNIASCSVPLESMGPQDESVSPSKQLSKESTAVEFEDMTTLGCEEPSTRYPDLGTGQALVMEENSNAVDSFQDSELSNGPLTEECSGLENVVVSSAARIVIDNAADAMNSLSEKQPPALGKSLLDAGLGTEGQINIDIQESWASVLKPGELLTIDLTVCSSAGPEQNLPSTNDDPTFFSEDVEEESRSDYALKALRKQDKDQAESLMLEGRVQMLVLQSEGQVFKCENCSYITRKERALSLHSKAGCLGRKSTLLCKECGASFKQQRGLNTHIMKRCPVIQKKNKSRTPFYLEHESCPTTRESVLQLESVSNELACAIVSSLSHNQSALGVQRSENGVEDLQESAGKVLADLCVPQEVVCEDLSCDALLREMTPGTNYVSGAECPSSPPRTDKYTFQQGKYHCSGCSFVCSRISTIICHVEEACKQLQQFKCHMCTEVFCSKMTLKGHQMEKHMVLESTSEGGSGTGSSKEDGDQGNSDQEQDGDTDVSETDLASDLPGTSELGRKTGSRKGKGECLFCPECPFTCYQERAMETHKKRGCLKSGEFQCPSCSFSCKSSSALQHHKQLHKKFYSKRPHLRCRHCEFTCKQSRCLKQHIRIRHEGVKPHKCAYCNFSTTRRYRLEAHESLHTGVGRIACDVCSQTFGTNSKLRIHKLRVHEKKPTHFCSLCDYSGYNQNDISRHMNSCHNGELRFSCSQCVARFSSETALKQHCLRKHEEKICLSCEHCFFVCHSDTTLKYHMQKQHPHLQCGTCKEVFDSREDLEGHKKSHFSHHCELCDFAAKERPQLVHHYTEAHEPGEGVERSLRCPFCDFACHHQLVFDHHMKGHGGTRAYKCSDCQYTTKNKQKITWHIRIHTGEKPYKCHLCAYACADPSRLKYHMRIHKDERKYLCPDCGYKCKWVNQLKYHMTKHTGYKPYQCDECEYCTNRADALRIHKETRHRDTRAFICEQCGKAFKTRFLLKTHMKKHSEDKPYVCNVCLRGFRWAAGLRHHYLTHTKEHPFFCRYCPYKAKQKFQVIKHIRRHHPEKAAVDPQEGVGKDPSAPTVHLHEVQLESTESTAPSLHAPAEAVA